MEKFAAVLVSVFVIAVAVSAQGVPNTPSDKHPAAVFMSGVEPVTAKGSYKVLGAELAKAITGSGRYIAVDRTEAIQKQIGGEQVFQRSGAVNDAQIRRLGVQFGVQFLCVAEVSQLADSSFFLEARLVNVETAQVLEIAAMNGALRTGKEMVHAAQRIARVLMTGRSGDESAEELFSRGRAMLNVDVDKAIAAFTDAIVQEPGEAEYYASRGAAHARKELFDRAVADYTEAIRLKPGEAEYHYSRGHAYFRKGDYSNAVSDLSEAIELGGSGARYLIARGTAYHLRKDLDRAAADIESALRIEPENIDAKGILKSIQEDQARAQALADSLRAALHYGKAHAFFLNGDYDHAVAEYAEAIALLPNSALYYNGRGAAYLSKESCDSAVADFAAAIRLNHGEALYYYNRGAAYYCGRHYEKAISDFQSVLRLAPDNAEAGGLIAAARKEIAKRDAPPPPEQPDDNKAPSAYANVRAGFQGASYGGGGSGGGSHWGAGVAGLLRTERINKFGLALGMGQSFNTSEDGGREFRLSTTSLYLQPLYRAGFKRRYFDASLTASIPLAQSIRMTEGGRTLVDGPADAEAAFAVDLSGRFDYAGLGVAKSLTGSATQLNVSLFWSMGSSGFLELVPTFAYHWGDGFGMWSVSAGVVVSFW